MRLLVLDVEGTLFQTTIRLPGTTLDSTIWQGIANALGAQAIEEEIESHRRWNAGGYPSYLDWMKDTISIHQRHGLSKTMFDEIIAAARYQPRVQETLSAIDRSRFEPVLVTGGFRELARRAQIDLGVYHSFAACEYFFSGGTLAGYNLLPCDFEGKLDFIQLMLREYGLAPDKWVFVGDGGNDVPIASNAPCSIGFQAHAHLKAVVTHAIDDFSRVLPILDSLD